MGLVARLQPIQLKTLPFAEAIVVNVRERRCVARRIEMG